MIQCLFGNCRPHRSLFSLLALTLATLAGPVGAITLGDFHVLSSLNSPLLATAPLRLDPSDGVGTALEARFASLAAHRDADIEVGEIHRNLVATLEAGSAVRHASLSRFSSSSCNCAGQAVGLNAPPAY